MCDQAGAIMKKGWISDLELENIWRIIVAEGALVNESIEDVGENEIQRDMVRTSERNEQIGDDLDETTDNATANVEPLDEET